MPRSITALEARALAKIRIRHHGADPVTAFVMSTRMVGTKVAIEAYSHELGRQSWLLPASAHVVELGSPAPRQMVVRVEDDGSTFPVPVDLQGALAGRRAVAYLGLTQGCRRGILTILTLGAQPVARQTYPDQFTPAKSHPNALALSYEDVVQCRVDNVTANARHCGVTVRYAGGRLVSRSPLLKDMHEPPVFLGYAPDQTEMAIMLGAAYTANSWLNNLKSTL